MLKSVPLTLSVTLSSFLGILMSVDETSFLVVVCAVRALLLTVAWV